MPGIKEPSSSTNPQNHHPPASISPSPHTPQLETTSNILPSNGLFGELSSTYHEPQSSNTSVPPSSLTSVPPLDSHEGSGTSTSPSLPPPPPPSEEQPRSRKVQIRNRRLHYLTTHHSTYFDNPTLELADPLLYDKCIRTFQTASEREAEGKRKGWSGVLHADLERAEARMEALRKATENRVEGDEEDDKVKSKEEGIELWEDAMTRRFLEGRDEDVDYKTIDDNEEYDDVKQIERDVQEAYFDAETPGDAVEGQTCTDTGIQDF